VSITSPTNNAAFPVGPTNITITANAAVTGGQIARVEFFAGGNKIGEDTTAPFSLTWSGVNAGPYTLTALATDNKGLTKLSDPIKITVGTPIRVNFQAASSEGYPDYMPDFGDVFDDRGNGYKYGWDVDNVANSRVRNAANSPDERYDTFNHMQKPQPAGSFWEIEVPNGRYNVFAVVGEASNFDSVFDLQAEGITIASGTASDAIRWFEGIGAVSVSDGKLTLTNGPKAANNKICFVEIYSLPNEVVPPEFAPPVRNGNQLTLTWTGDGKLQENSEVTGSWTDVPGNPSGTYTTTTTGPRKFYRVVAP